MKVSEAAEKYGVDTAEIWARVAAGRLNAHRSAQDQPWVITEEPDLCAWCGLVPEPLSKQPDDVTLCAWCGRPVVSKPLRNA